MKTVKIGIMSFAHLHALSYAECINKIAGAELVGIADDNAARGQEMSERFKAKFFGSYDELLAQDIDAVIICAENIYHKELTIKAAEAGKHILCEKPLATSVEDGRAMIEACEKAGVKLQVCFPSRFGTAIKNARQAILDGKIGDIIAIKGTNRGKCPGGWFTDPALSGGGAILDHTVHVVDLMRWFTGSEVSEVYAEIGSMIDNKDYDDMGTLTVQFENGVFGTIDPSWSKPKSYPIWGDLTLGVIGSEGAIWLDLLGQKIDLYTDKTMTGSWEYWGDDLNFWMLTSFVNAALGDQPVEVTGEDGLAATSVALAAYEASRKGEPVKL